MDIKEAARALDSYRERAGQLDAERDQLIRDARAAGMNIRQIHLHSGVSRSAIYRVLGVGPAGEEDADQLDNVMKRLAGMPQEGGRQ